MVATPPHACADHSCPPRPPSPRRCSTQEPTGARKRRFDRAIARAIAARGPVDTAAVTWATVSINTYIWVIQKDSTRTGGNIPDTMITNQVNILNAAYEPHGFQFGPVTTTRRTNASWWGISLGGTLEREMKTQLRRGTAKDLNIYLTGLSSYLGWATFPDGESLRCRLWLRGTLRWWVEEGFAAR